MGTAAPFAVRDDEDLATTPCAGMTQFRFDGCHLSLRTCADTPASLRRPEPTSRPQSTGPGSDGSQLCFRTLVDNECDRTQMGVVPTGTDPRRLRDAMRELLSAHGALEPARRPCGTPLGLPHAHALLELRARGPMTVSALAARSSIDRTNVSRLCARMEALGELRRAEDPKDRRARRLALTAAGRRAADRVDSASAAHFAAVIDRLGGDEDAIVDALERLASAMRTSQNAIGPAGAGTRSRMDDD